MNVYLGGSTLGEIEGLSVPMSGEAPPPSGEFVYLRPDGVSEYNRPEGTSLYFRP